MSGPGLSQDESGPPSRVPGDVFGPGSPLRVIGHRGASLVAPENTLPGFQHAVDVGADAVELDIHSTRDGEIVVIHDPTLERTTSGEGEIATQTLREIKKVDAGYWFTPDRGRTYPFRGQGCTIPTLQEVLDVTSPLPVIVEIKSPLVGPILARWLQKSPDRDRILVGGFNREETEEACAVARWRCAYQTELRSYVLLGKVGLGGLVPPRGSAAMVPERHGVIRIVTPRFVRRAHRDGLGVFVWTVNEARDMRRLWDWGVDGLLSDAPARARRILDERIAAGTPTRCGA